MIFVIWFSKESWINTISVAIEKAKESLLGSAFSGDLYDNFLICKTASKVIMGRVNLIRSGSISRIFSNHVQREDIQKQKRSLMAVRIVEAEKQYISVLEKIVKVFFFEGS